MTSAAAASTPARLAADPAAVAALAIAAIAAATLAGAWFFQLVLDIRPCPLCLEQRYAYYLALPLALVVAFAASRGAPRQVVLAGVGHASCLEAPEQFTAELQAFLSDQ